MHEEGRGGVLEFYPPGSYYETSDTTFNPNKSWGGNWELDQSGTAMVSKSNSSTSAFKVPVGTIVGEEKHILLVSEIPSHSHYMKDFNGNRVDIWGGRVADVGTDGSPFGGIIAKNWSNMVSNTVGNNQSHNNIQPSKVICRWHRLS